MGAMTDLAADLQGTQWRFVRPLARGGMGEVSVVEHVELGTLGVAKLLHADLDRQDQLTARLRREARMLTRLTHENLVRVLDFGWTRTRRGFLVTELLEGESLGDRLKREDELPVEEALRFAIATLEGLAVVHSGGFVHRDLKPDNLFLAREARTGEAPSVLKILDFGIAKVTTVEAGEAAGPGPKTATGMVVGTPSYLAPEQAGGGVIDERTDIYSMGCVLFRMLAGRPPFVRMRAVDLLGAHILEPAAPPSSVARQTIPSTLDAAVLRALSKDPKHRFQSAEQMRLVLAEVLRALQRPLQRPVQRATELMPRAPARSSPSTAASAAAATPTAPRAARPTVRMLAGPPLPRGATQDELDAPTILRSSPIAYAEQETRSTAEVERRAQVRAAIIGTALGLLIVAMIAAALALSPR